MVAANNSTLKERLLSKTDSLHSIVSYTSSLQSAHHHKHHFHLLNSMPAHQDQRECARAVLPLLAWICGIAVALSLRYGYYGDSQIVVGPNTSRMMRISSFLVEAVQVKERGKGGVVVYGFSAKPELVSARNWSVSKSLNVGSYSRKGFSVWLNKGSTVSTEWEIGSGGGGSRRGLLVVLIKGNIKETKKLEELQYYPSTNDVLNNSRDGKSAGYTIPDDDTYFVGVVNLTPQSVEMSMNVSVSLKMYDTSGATSICSTVYGVCKLRLSFPSTLYYVLATSDTENNVSSDPWSIEFSFLARLAVYFLITVLIVVVISMILKHLGGCNYSENTREEQVPVPTETDPIVPSKVISFSYGTNEEEPQSSLCCSSEDIYDGKICIICFDERRNSFFIPCGHSATCYTCAKRIMEEDNKNCPICRRLIHKPKKLPSPKDK